MTPATREAVERYDVRHHDLYPPERDLAKAHQWTRVVPEAKYDALAAEVEGLRRAITEHNDSVEASCRSMQKHINCDAYLRRGRASCPECPRDWMIELPAAPSRGEEEDDNWYPIVRCPKCKREQVDYDGFSFIACIPGCGYCTHPSLTDGVCGICKVKP